MAYAFDRADADLSASLRRIAQEELGAALGRLGRVDEPSAVHGIRKNLKKTRALLRLVRSGLREQAALNVALREVGLALSARRDAQVRLESFDRLFPEPPEALLPLRATLQPYDAGPVATIPATLRPALEAVHDSARDWTLSGKGNRILREGLALTRSRAWQAARAARHAPDEAERIHDWRKRVKDHWYLSRLFAPCWPDLFRPIVASADRLGEALGDHHDLSVLAAHVAGLPDTTVPNDARDLLDARIRDAQSRIEAVAFPLSDRLFAGDPDETAALWVDWLKLWRGLDRR